MKIVNIIGGLGNQMFQYAFAISLKHMHPDEDIYVDTTHFNYILIKKFKGANLHNGFEIKSVFPNADVAQAGFFQLIKITWYIPNYFFSRIVRKILPLRKHEYIQDYQNLYVSEKQMMSINEDCYYEGYWQCVDNFKESRDEIIKQFEHGIPNAENENIIKKMQEVNSVGIHIRRGDYLHEPAYMHICDLDYYKRAIALILEKKADYTFYIFSNDMEWCKENILPLLKCNSVVQMNSNKGANSCWDMILMSYCKDLIIANSSFSWWGAFLNKRNGRIVTPKKWVNDIDNCNIWLDNWIKV